MKPGHVEMAFEEISFAKEDFIIISFSTTIYCTVVESICTHARRLQELLLLPLFQTYFQPCIRFRGAAALGKAIIIYTVVTFFAKRKHLAIH